MGWSIGYDDRWKRDIGYAVPAICDQPGCGKNVDRGLEYVCGSEPYGGDYGCGLHFCGAHRTGEIAGKKRRWWVCERCEAGKPPFDPKPDTAEWVEWKLADGSWEQWRAENAGLAEQMRASLVPAGSARPAGD